MDYKNGKIYKISNIVNDLVYIGSTTQSLSRRMSYHRSSINVKSKSTSRLYTEMREIGCDNFFIELLENFPCDTKEELHAREMYYIRDYDSLNNGLNKYCSIIDTIRLTQCKMKNRENNKIWYKNNEDYAKNKHKEWYQNNNEYVKAKHHEYREKNKQKIKDYRNELITCDVCHIQIIRDSYHKHKKSKKHLSNMQNN
jgi:hypothetical protein